MSSKGNMEHVEEFVAANSDFLKAVMEAKNIEEAQAVCAEYNMELPETVWKEIVSNTSASGDELSEDELFSISGGFSGDYLLKTLGGVAGLGVTIAAANPIGIAVACAWIGYNGYRTFR